MKQYEAFSAIDPRSLPRVECDFMESPTNGLLQALDRLEGSEAVALVIQGVPILISRQRMADWVDALQERAVQAIRFQPQPGDEVGKVYLRARQQCPELALSVYTLPLDPTIPAYRALSEVIRAIESKVSPWVPGGKAVTVTVGGQPRFYLMDLDVDDALLAWLQEAKTNRMP